MAQRRNRFDEQPDLKPLTGLAPPHNLDAERAVLGSILLDPSVEGDVAQVLRAEDFHHEAHRKIYEAIRRLSDQGREIDLTILADALHASGEIDSVGGDVYLAGLEASVVATSAAPEYARIVRDKATLRTLMSVAVRIANQAAEEKDDATTLVERAERMVFEVGEDRQVGDLRSMARLLEETLQEISNAAARTSGTGLKTNYPDLDDILGGIDDTALLILAARPSVGKTAFALSLLVQVVTMASPMKPVAFFSLEMGAEQLNKRLLAMASKLPAENIRDGRLNKEQMAKLMESASTMMEWPVFIDDTAGLTLTQLRSRARRLKSQQPDLALIIVDYMQLMDTRDSAGGKNRSRQEEVAEISRGMKLLAKELRTPILALSQLSRNIEQRSGRTKGARPMLSDLRESGSIEQDADVVMFVHREKPKDDRPESEREQAKDLAVWTEVIVGKNRNGRIGDAPFWFLPRSASFGAARWSEKPE